jgi:uncharacterized protein (TIGR00255 family)
MTKTKQHAPLRSMTGYAQVKGKAGESSFTLSLKAVNHRYLDLQLRLPVEMDALEMKLRRVLKEKLARGHVELGLAFEGGGTANFQVNHDLVGGYVRAFQSAAEEFGISATPDLNAIFKLPGALTAGAAQNGDFDAAVLAQVDAAIERLNHMREQEGAGIGRELRERVGRLDAATKEVEKLRAGVSKAYLQKVETRMRELIGTHADAERILQEAALLAERSDIQEEIARMHTHIAHFLDLLGIGGEVGKKLDFLLQEMNRETNTLLSKTTGVSGDALRITELGLNMKAEIEKLREQVQNLE